MSAVSRTHRFRLGQIGTVARPLAQVWDRHEGPTWCVAVAVYGCWLGLLRYHGQLPWWAIVPLGAWIVAWHGSLQHETIHSFASVPRPLRTAIAAVPLGIFFPYGSYAREHRRHHRAIGLTDPRLDPESFYHDPERWNRYSPALRSILRFNQTLLGRLLVGAMIQSAGAVRSDVRRIKQGDRRPLRDWAIHLPLVFGLFAWVTIIADMPWWEYIALIAYPGASLAMLRSFYEHSWSPQTARRTNVVENRFPFGLLFLNNNYHVVHHAAPALPWYRIPAVWHEHRDVFIEENRGRYFKGYGALARHWFLRAVFDPVSPSE